MKLSEIASTILATTGIVLLPMLGLMWKISSKWTRLEMQMQRLNEELRSLVLDKERVHAIIQDQVTKDREATDKRLRWLETHLWQRIGNDRKDAA